MDTWVIWVGVGVLVLFAIYCSGAQAEKYLNYRWLVQFKDQTSNDISMRVFSSKQIFDGSRELRRNIKDASLDFKAADEEIRQVIYPKWQQGFLNHPANSSSIAPLSFRTDHNRHPPKAVVDWLDLMSRLAGEEVVAVYFYDDGEGSSLRQPAKYKVECPGCGKNMNIPVGKKLKVTCPHCSKKFGATTL